MLALTGFMDPKRGSGSEEESRTERIGARFFLRSSNEYSLQDGVSAIGIRRHKAYMIVRKNTGENLVLSAFRLPDAIKAKMQNVAERDQLTRLLCEGLSCRYVDRALDVRYASVDGLIFTMHRLYQFGSLRDCIHACPPRKAYFEKYCMPCKPLVSRRTRMHTPARPCLAHSLISYPGPNEPEQHAPCNHAASLRAPCRPGPAPASASANPPP